MRAETGPADVDLLRRRGERDAAETAARELLERTPDDTAARVALARVLIAGRRLDEAEQVLAAAQEADPADERPVAWRIVVLDRRYDHDEAERVGREACERFPAGRLVRIALGRVYLDASRPREALAPLAEAVRIAPGDPTAVGWHATCLAGVRRRDEAVAALRGLVAADPAAVEAHYRLGRILLEDHHAGEALAAFDAALAADPHHPGALEWRITTLRRLRRDADAAAAAEHAVAVLPRRPRLHVERAWVYADQRRYDEALTHLATALDADPGHPWALRSRIQVLVAAGRHEEAEQAADDALRLRPDDPDIHVTAAWVRGETGRYDRALAHLDAALDRHPHDPWVHRNRSDVLRALRRYDEAGQAAAEAIRLDPDDPGAHLTAAWVCDDLGRLEEALTHVDAAVAAEPRHPRALRNRIELLRALERHDEAEQAAADVLAVHPDDPDTHVSAAWVSRDRDRLDEALARAGAALALDPRNLRALRSRIDLLRGARRFAEAERAAEEALRLRPDSPDLHVSAAWAVANQDRDDEALTHVDAALALRPGHVWALRSRIDLLRGLLRHEDAERAAAEAVRLRPQDPDVHLTAARVWDDQDRDDEALACFDRALELDPRSVVAWRGRVTALRGLLRYEEAEQAAADALRLHPDDADLHTTVAWVYGAQDHDDEALAHAAAALAADPQHIWALRSRIDFLRSAHRFEQADRAAGELLRLHPENAGAHVSAAWLRGDEGRYEEELACFERALELAPRYPVALRGRLSALRDLCRWDEAEQAAADALRLHPDDPEMHVAEGWLHYELLRFERALACYDRALAHRPRQLQALRWRITVLNRLRRFAEAEQAGADALRVHPGVPDLHTTVARGYSERDRHDEALARVDAALAVHPRDSWALRSRIDFLRSERRYEDAERAGADALRLRPQDAALHVTVGWLYDDLDRAEEALACYERALAIDPRNTRALEWRSITLRRLRRFEEAERACAQALRLHPTHPDLLLESGRLLDDRLAFDAALEVFTEVLRSRPHHVDALVAKSATLRSLRHFTQAERDLTPMARAIPTARDLRAELGWIHHDAQRLPEARRVFQELLDDAVSGAERAMARNGLAWIDFAAQAYGAAEEGFRAAVADCPDVLDYQLGLAWSLTRRTGEERHAEAERLAYRLTERRQDPSAHVCLGILAFQRGDAASSEYHLKRSLEVDPYHGSHTDLGSLYARLARHDEAEAQLRLALERDWYDTAAHVELGSLHLQQGEQDLDRAEREFRQALAISPDSGSAAIGLAQAAARKGNEAEAETTLREALLRAGGQDRWRIHLALSRLLVQRADKQQNPDLHAEAYAQAQQAIGCAPDAEADPHFVAGVAHHRIGSLTAEGRGRLGFRRRATHHLRECLRRDPGNIEAERSLQLLERETRATAPMLWGGYAVALLSLVLLALMWAAFFLSDKVNATVVSVNTPILVGLFTISTLLPALIRLKLPGFEADLQAGTDAISSGPTGEVTFGPGRFTVTGGPMGQLPRLE